MCKAMSKKVVELMTEKDASQADQKVHYFILNVDTVFFVHYKTKLDQLSSYFLTFNIKL